MTTVTAVGTPLPAAASVKKSPKQLPAPNSDFHQLSDVSTAEEKAIIEKVRGVHGDQGRADHQQVLVRRLLPVRVPAGIQGAEDLRPGL